MVVILSFFSPKLIAKLLITAVHLDLDLKPTNRQNNGKALSALAQ